ncbi:hypothetical protein L208DRAFT_1046733, partial [Tricholoma matsutake]
CKVLLRNNQHCFCPNDAACNMICVIIGCNSPTVPNSQACSDPTHQEIEHIHQERGQARFQLNE